MKTLLISVLLCIPSLALADELGGVDPHLNVGFEVLGGANVFSGGVRTHVGMDRTFGHGHVRPSIGVGATFGLANLQLDDSRALDGSVGVGHYDYGPELQLGLRWANGGIVDTRVFASVAYLKVDVDDRLMLDPIAGVVGGSGLRASVGATWTDALARLATSNRGDDTDISGLLLFLVPQQAEIVFERSAGSDRYGFAASWGF